MTYYVCVRYTDPGGAAYYALSRHTAETAREAAGAAFESLSRRLEEGWYMWQAEVWEDEPQRFTPVRLPSWSAAE